MIFIAVGFLVILICFTFHFHAHFRVQCCCKHPKEILLSMLCCCCYCLDTDRRMYRAHNYQKNNTGKLMNMTAMLRVRTASAVDADVVGELAVVHKAHTNTNTNTNTHTNNHTKDSKVLSMPMRMPMPMPRTTLMMSSNCNSPPSSIVPSLRSPSNSSVDAGAGASMASPPSRRLSLSHKFKQMKHSQSKNKPIRFRNASAASWIDLHSDERKCCLKSVDEELQFFPYAMQYYLCFVGLLSILIACKFLFLYDHHHHHHNHHKDAIANMHSDFLAQIWKHNLFVAGAGIVGEHNNNNNNNSMTVLDVLLVYSCLLLFVGESLFNFYRYFSMNYACLHFTNASVYQIMRRFVMYYWSPFTLLFVIQMHLWYWIFPLLIGLHVLFNLVCVLRFANILIAQQRRLADDADLIVSEASTLEFTSTIILMRRLSIISTLISTFVLLLLTFVFDENVFYVLPFFWGLSCIALTLNFVRNRQLLRRYSIRQQMCCRVHCNYYTQVLRDCGGCGCAGRTRGCALGLGGAADDARDRDKVGHNNNNNNNNNTNIDLNNDTFEQRQRSSNLNRIHLQNVQSHSFFVDDGGGAHHHSGHDDAATDVQPAAEEEELELEIPMEMAMPVSVDEEEDDEENDAIFIMPAAAKRPSLTQNRSTNSSLSKSIRTFAFEVSSNMFPHGINVNMEKTKTKTKTRVGGDAMGMGMGMGMGMDEDMLPAKDQLRLRGHSQSDTSILTAQQQHQLRRLAVHTATLQIDEDMEMDRVSPGVRHHTRTRKQKQTQKQKQRARPHRTRTRTHNTMQRRNSELYIHTHTDATAYTNGYEHRRKQQAVPRMNTSSRNKPLKLLGIDDSMMTQNQRRVNSKPYETTTATRTALAFIDVNINHNGNHDNNDNRHDFSSGSSSSSSSSFVFDDGRASDSDDPETTGDLSAIKSKDINLNAVGARRSRWQWKTLTRSELKLLQTSSQTYKSVTPTVLKKTRTHEAKYNYTHAALSLAAAAKRPSLFCSLSNPTQSRSRPRPRPRPTTTTAATKMTNRNTNHNHHDNHSNSHRNREPAATVTVPMQSDKEHAKEELQQAFAFADSLWADFEAQTQSKHLISSSVRPNTSTAAVDDDEDNDGHEHHDHGNSADGVLLPPNVSDIDLSVKGIEIPLKIDTTMEIAPITAEEQQALRRRRELRVGLGLELELVMDDEMMDVDVDVNADDKHAVIMDMTATRHQSSPVHQQPFGRLDGRRNHSNNTDDDHHNDDGNNGGRCAADDAAVVAAKNTRVKMGKVHRCAQSLDVQDSHTKQLNAHRIGMPVSSTSTLSSSSSAKPSMMHTLSQSASFMDIRKYLHTTIVTAAAAAGKRKRTRTASPTKKQLRFTFDDDTHDGDGDEPRRAHDEQTHDGDSDENDGGNDSGGYDDNGDDGDDTQRPDVDEFHENVACMLNIFVQQGFYCPKQLNSVRELDRYNVSRNASRAGSAAASPRSTVAAVAAVRRYRTNARSIGGGGGGGSSTTNTTTRPRFATGTDTDSANNNNNNNNNKTRTRTRALTHNSNSGSKSKSSSSHRSRDTSSKMTRSISQRVKRAMSPRARF